LNIGGGTIMYFQLNEKRTLGKEFAGL